MVLTYMVHTLHPTHPVILYSQHLNHRHVAASSSGDTETSPARSSDRLLVTCRRVYREYQFASQMAGRRYNVEEELDRLRHDGTMPSFPTGIYAPSSDEKHHDDEDGCAVLWCGAATVAFVLVVGRSENRGLAEASLAHSVRLLQEYVQAVTSPKEVLLRCDQVMHVIEHIFPLGQLVFRNARMIGQLEKDLEQAIIKLKQR